MLTEGNTNACVIARTSPIRRRRRPWHASTLSAREPGGLHTGLGLLRPRHQREADEAKPMRQCVEKSDALIVPVKRANKTERSVAERVEGSGAEKRNAELQSTVRTQRRVAVSQAQIRIREAINNVFASHTQLKSRMRENCQSGSVRGALSNERPYRDHITAVSARRAVWVCGRERGARWGGREAARDRRRILQWPADGGCVRDP